MPAYNESTIPSSVSPLPSSICLPLLTGGERVCLHILRDAQLLMVPLGLIQKPSLVSSTETASVQSQVGFLAPPLLFKRLLTTCF